MLPIGLLWDFFLMIDLRKIFAVPKTFPKLKNYCTTILFYNDHESFSIFLNFQEMSTYTENRYRVCSLENGDWNSTTKSLSRWFLWADQGQAWKKSAAWWAGLVVLLSCRYIAQKAIMKFQFLPHFGNPQVYQVDMKNVVKYWKDFLWYFTILEIYRGQWCHRE